MCRSEDIGGFFRPGNQYSDEGYHELLTRWFQFGAFTPIYRVHGGGSHTEIWNYGDDTEQRLNNTNNLRYRFLPYTYSGFHRVETEGYTMQRSLAFDYASDPRVYNIADQFLFGDSVMVAPVVTPVDNQNKKRSVYFPAGTWVNFWTGDAVQGGASRAVDASLDIIPLFVKAGAIVPLGPFVKHTNEVADPLEIRIFAGANAAFTLYEDDGHSRDYLSGNYSSISFSYEDSSSTLHIAARQGGGFKGMLSSRTLNLVKVTPGKGTGLVPSDKPDRVVRYMGKSMDVVV